MSNFVYIATSLDGYIATIDGDIKWLSEIPNPSNTDYGFYDFLGRVDAIVMGRNTFEKVLTFSEWPYTKEVFVLTTKDIQIPEKLNSKVRALKGTPKEVSDKLTQMGYKNLYIDGGNTIRRFLSANLIDEIVISQVPIILGDGIHLFAKTDIRLNLKHFNTTVYDNGIVKSHYVRK